MALALLLSSCGGGSDEVPEGSRRHSLCGVGFTLPAQLRVSLEPAQPGSAPSCEIRVSPPSGSARSPDDPGGAFLLIRVYAASFEDAAAEAGFEQTPAGWIVRGRQMIATEAHAISGTGWKGVRGAPLVGSFDEGGYGGLEDSPRAVLSNGRGVSAVVDSRSRAEVYFDEILRTLRFSN